MEVEHIILIPLVPMLMLRQFLSFYFGPNTQIAVLVDKVKQYWFMAIKFFGHAYAEWQEAGNNKY